MQMPRKAGVLVHPTSLPGLYGIGEIGSVARSFVHTLKVYGQTYWQVLPLGPTGYADSPYQSTSTFAGNPMLICFDDLQVEGLLLPEEVAGFPEFPRDRVDYGPVLEHRGAVLAKVCRAFSSRASAELKASFKSFCQDQAYWLEDYALFTALKEENGLRPWIDWAPEYRSRDARALKAFAKAQATRVEHAKLRQFLFDRQWRLLRETAHAAGVKLVGDLPIFVAHDSADVWAHPELFYLDDEGMPTVVAGVPPGSCGEIRCTVGICMKSRAMPGGCVGWSICWSGRTSCGLTTSAALPDTGKCRPEKKPR
jgi:4-alpha-glucanotransferase